MRVPTEVQQTEELVRIASALERIAAAFEIVAAERGSRASAELVDYFRRVLHSLPSAEQRTAAARLLAEFDATRKTAKALPR